MRSRPSKNRTSWFGSHLDSWLQFLSLLVCHLTSSIAPPVTSSCRTTAPAGRRGARWSASRCSPQSESSYSPCLSRAKSRGPGGPSARSRCRSSRRPPNDMPRRKTIAATIVDFFMTFPSSSIQRTLSRLGEQELNLKPQLPIQTEVRFRQVAVHCQLSVAAESRLTLNGYQSTSFPQSRLINSALETAVVETHQRRNHATVEAT